MSTIFNHPYFEEAPKVEHNDQQNEAACGFLCEERIKEFPHMRISGCAREKKIQHNDNNMITDQLPLRMRIKILTNDNSYGNVLNSLSIMLNETLMIKSESINESRFTKHHIVSDGETFKYQFSLDSDITLSTENDCKSTLTFSMLDQLELLKKNLATARQSVRY